MMITRFADLIKRVCLDQTLVVYIAHVYEHGYWKSYSKHFYKVYEFNQEKILGYNIDHPTEHIRIDEGMMDGYLKVEF